MVADATRTPPDGAEPPGTEPSGPLAALVDRWASDPAAARCSAASAQDLALTLAVPEAFRAFWLAALARSLQRPVVAVVPTATDVERLADDLAAFGTVPARLDAWETLPYEHVSPTVETMGGRLATLHAWRSAQPPPLTLLPVRALLQRCAPTCADVPVRALRRGAVVDLDDLARTLTAMGYERSFMVEARGEFAVRGGILDVFPSTAAQPVRIELWGDEIDSVRVFSVADQRSVGTVDAVTVLPCRELIADDGLRERARRLAGVVPGGREALGRIADGEFFAGMESWLPWLLDDGEGAVAALLPDDALVVLVDPRRCLDRASDLANEEEDLAAALEQTWSVPTSGALERIVDTDTDDDTAGDTADTSAGDAAGVDTASLTTLVEDAGGRPTRRAATPAGDDGTAAPRLFVPAASVLASVRGPVWHAPPHAEGPDVASVGAAAFEVAPTPDMPAVVARRLRTLLVDGHRVVVAVEAAASVPRLARHLVDEGLSLDVTDDLAADGPDASGGVFVVAPLHRGFVSEGMRLAVVAEADITGRRRTRRRARTTRRRAGADASQLYGDLRPGDHVVHHHHGVGRFEGVTTRTVDDTAREYLEIAYAGGDRLFVPVDQLDAVRRYVGGEIPRLSRMGGSDWTRTKNKVRKAVAEVADELVRLYRDRMLAPGRVFPPDGDLMANLVESFPYEETPDQAKAIADVSADMENAVAMDRLVCGDVGYGKTEIAVRAALKAVTGGAQVAVLVPTTVLAQQHHATFSERFADLPVRVEVLSRFLSAAEQRAVVRAVAAGEVDVIIGTHRLLGADVEVPRLGLLIVDEEQRFGVKAKERLKELRASVDVLTMTATPIPRTLEFAMTGIRDMSVVNTPPEDRRPVLTYVGPFDESSVAAAVRRELLRDGQVFYVHNRVRSIELVAEQLRRLVPEARVGVAHGQMDDGALEAVMVAFNDGEIDVLVATTIIESGLDIARANTLIVDRADLLGLAQLYQLRGRVGRSRARAYAYLYHPPGRRLSEEAHERLKVIAEHTDLGSGFAIALRDLELRGAGNLLGATQSGHIAAVGFDLYCQLVNEAVAAFKGEEVAEPEPVRVELPVQAVIPEDYMPRESLRLEAYRRLADVRDVDAIDDVREEWADRYGPVPDTVENLLALARVRVAALRAGVRDVVFVRDRLRLSPYVPTGSRRVRLERLHPGTVVNESQELVMVPYKNPQSVGRGAGARITVDPRHVCEWAATLLQELA